MINKARRRINQQGIVARIEKVDVIMESSGSLKDTLAKGDRKCSRWVKELDNCPVLLIRKQITLFQYFCTCKGNLKNIYVHYYLRQLIDRVVIAYIVS